MWKLEQHERQQIHKKGPVRVCLVCVCLCMHLYLTSTELLAPMLGHCDLSVYEGLPFQNILIMAVGHRLLLTRLAVMLRPVAVAVASVDLGEDSGFVEQSQVSLEVKVRVQILFCALSEALIVLWPQWPSSDSVPQVGLLQ